MSGRGIVQVQSISSPDTVDPPEPPEPLPDPPEPPEPPEPPDPLEPPEPLEPPPELPDPEEPSVPLTMSTAVIVSFPFLITWVTWTVVVLTVKDSVTFSGFPLLSGEHFTSLFFLSTTMTAPATLYLRV